jgi:hypothetical protein
LAQNLSWLQLPSRTQGGGRKYQTILTFTHTLSFAHKNVSGESPQAVSAMLTVATPSRSIKLVASKNLVSLRDF